MVVFEQVTKVYPGSWWGRTPDNTVLNGLSFTAQAGQVTGIVGGNGAGKTTAFRVLAGLEPWNSGTISINGVNARTDPQWVRTHVGILLEKHGFHKVSGRLVLEQSGLFMGLTRKQAQMRADELIAALDMGSFVNNIADKYSRGQLGRLGIARMMVAPAQVLIFDEPTVGLDFSSAEKVRRFIRTCADQGHTVLLATHLLSDIKQLCNELVGLENGVRVDSATVQQWLMREEERV